MRTGKPGCAWRGSHSACREVVLFRYDRDRGGMTAPMASASSILPSDPCRGSRPPRGPVLDLGNHAHAVSRRMQAGPHGCRRRQATGWPRSPARASLSVGQMRSRMGVMAPTRPVSAAAPLAHLVEVARFAVDRGPASLVAVRHVRSAPFNRRPRRRSGGPPRGADRPPSKPSSIAAPPCASSPAVRVPTPRCVSDAGSNSRGRVHPFDLDAGGGTPGRARPDRWRRERRRPLGAQRGESIRQGAGASRPIDQLPLRARRAAAPTLKIVRTPSSRRTVPSSFIAG